MAIIKIRNAAIDLDAAEIPNLPATKITTGTLADARVPNLNASKITAGTIAAARLGSGTANATTFLRGDNTFAEAGGGASNAFRNIFINGDMSIAQRATSGTLQNGTGGYLTVDRWKTYEGGSESFVFTVSQDSDVPTGQGFVKSLKFDCTTADASLAADGALSFRQAIEGQNIQYLKKGTSNAVSTTLSFWVKSYLTGTYIISLVDVDNTRSISASYTISSQNTWEKKTITYPGDTSGAFGNDNGNSLQVEFYLGAGSNYTSGTLQTSWGSRVNANQRVGQVNLASSTNNNFWITGVQLEAGTSASDFEFLPFDVNLKRCSRYYQKTYDYSTYGGNSLTGMRTTDGSNGSLTTSDISGSLSYEFTMRAAPTVSPFDRSGNPGVCSRLNPETARTDNQQLDLKYIGTKNFGITSDGTVNAACIDMHYIADAEL